MKKHQIKYMKEKELEESTSHLACVLWINS